MRASRQAAWIGHVIVGLFVLAACAGQARGPALLEPVEAGPYSQMAARTFAVITQPDEFAALYQRIHAGRLPPRVPPKIDFEHHVVVAAFMGRRSTAGYGIVLNRVASVRDGVVTIAFAETRPSPDTGQAAVMTAPYAIAALPRGDYAAVRFVDADGDEVMRVALDASSV